MKIFVSNDISEKGVALLREHFDVDVMPNMKPEELIKVINNYDGLVTRSMTKVTKEVIEQPSVIAFGDASSLDAKARFVANTTLSQNHCVILPAPFQGAYNR